MNIKIAIAYHKPATILKGENIFPLHVGKAISDVDLGIQGDNTGDNISEKNPLYCELTGIYWLWKNTTADYKGLMHYRRIFTLQKDYTYKNVILKAKIAFRSLLSVFRPLNSYGMRIEYFAGTEDNYRQHAEIFDNKIEKILRQGTKIIVPSPEYCFLPVSVTFAPAAPHWAIQLIGEIAEESYPDFAEIYKQSLGKHYIYQRNMFVMDNTTYNEYCTFLFSVLQAFEERSISNNYLKDIKEEKAVSRIIGYLGELITNAFIQYCIAKGKKVQTLPLMIFDNSQEYAGK